jgi:hypothetical protein
MNQILGDAEEELRKENRRRRKEERLVKKGIDPQCPIKHLQRHELEILERLLKDQGYVRRPKTGKILKRKHRPLSASQIVWIMQAIFLAKISHKKVLEYRHYLKEKGIL